MQRELVYPIVAKKPLVCKAIRKTNIRKAEAFSHKFVFILLSIEW